jgi:4-alpha-glucanotransferase
LLLHVTSLPGGPFTGDLGPSAHAFADFLAEAGQSWWQTLPLNPIGEGCSPYSSIASFAAEPLMVSPALLAEDGLLTRDSLLDVPIASTTWQVDFAKSKALRSRLLRTAHRAFVDDPKRFATPFAEFREREREWLDDYCMFAALDAYFEDGDWTRWPTDIATRDPQALASAGARLGDHIDYLAFEQFVFDRQWRRLKNYCSGRGIGIIGDIPMFVSHRSADVWAHQSAFLLRQDGQPEFVAGAPPDAFAHEGQRWGNALYDWDVHEQTGFAWWKSRIQRQLELFDVVRLDHFIGFSRYWRIPAESDTAMGGRWIPAPGEKLFDALAETLGTLPLIAEDLGSVSQEVWDLRDRYHLPGMKVLQFGFNEGDGNVHSPSNYPAASVAYTGTHDSDTTLGWYQAIKTRAHAGDHHAQSELAEVQATFGTDQDQEITPAAINALFESPANTVILPAQDLLNLDGSHRMNTPGTDEGNWVWRLQSHALTKQLAEELRALTKAVGRG